jgi:glutamine cyclotransferase
MIKICILLLLIVTFADAQTAAELFQQAQEAYEKKDYVANVRLLEKSIEAGADHPTILYFLARGYALTGNQDSAIRTLNQLADQRLSYKPEEDSQFASIHESRLFREVVERFQANLKPVEISKIALTIADSSFVPEGIAYDSRDQRFYFGGITPRKIVSYKDGKFQEFSKPEDGLWSVLGMKVDDQNRTLWVASSALNGEDKGRSGIFQYDLEKQKLMNRYILPEGNHGLGEVSIDSKGNVFATDSLSPAVYQIKDGNLVMIVGPEPFRSPQGACFFKDEKILFVADYSRGIFAIDPATGKHRKLTRSKETTSVSGIDGLYCHNGTLIAIQNGVQPNRILRIHVNQDATNIERIDILESNHNLYPEPTLGVLVGENLYYIANSMIAPYLENPETQLKPAVILKLPLNQ